MAKINTKNTVGVLLGLYAINYFVSIPLIAPLLDIQLIHVLIMVVASYLLLIKTGGSK